MYRRSTCRRRWCGSGPDWGARFAISCPRRCAATSPPTGCIVRSLMLKSLVTKVVGTRFRRELKRIQPLVDAIHHHEERLKGIPDADVQGQTERFRALIAEGTGALAVDVERLKQAKHDCPDAPERAALSDKLAHAEEKYARALQAALDDILPEAFATVREACRRLLGSKVVVTGHEVTWDMVPYDVQLIGGGAVHQGEIGQMATGGGETLLPTIPLLLNAPGRGGSRLGTPTNSLARPR